MNLLWVVLASIVLFLHETRTASCDGVVKCYWSASSNSRPSVGSFGVNDIPLDICTHVIWSFIGLDSAGGITDLVGQETVNNKSNTFEDFIGLREKNSDVKLMVAIGGWNEGSDHFSPVVNNDTLRANFIVNVVAFLEKYGFDGLDLDWEYPAQRGGIAADKEMFVTLCKELKAIFVSRGWILSAAVAVTQSHIDLSYDVPALNEALDYINLMTYDYHGTWDSVTGVNSPLFAQLTDSPTLNLNINTSVHTWIANGADPAKLVIGIPIYGKTFTLTSLENTDTGAPFTGPGVPGPYTEAAGTWAYYEICEAQKNYRSQWNITQTYGYAYGNNDEKLWVGYETPYTAYNKGKYAKKHGLAGVMYWSVDMDDFSSLCGHRFPIIRAGAKGYNSS